jgi:hypothetical protein
MPEPHELARLTPEVHTLARPQVIPLIAARGVVQRNGPVRAVFEQARKEKWTPELLAGAITPTLEEQLEATPEQAVEVAQYLADEFFQLGDAILLCDKDTGRAIARITEDDMYQPPDVRRETLDGSIRMAKPLPRLNPNLEGFLVSYVFEEARDKQMLAAIQGKLPQTQFLQEVGDVRLNRVTRAGRTMVAQSVRAELPDVLAGVQGAARAFLDLFPPELPTGAFEMSALPQQTASSKGRQRIVDQKAANLSFSWETALKARIGAGWVRDIASQLVNEARQQIHKDEQTITPLDLLTPEHVEGRNLWVGNPATCLAIQRVSPPGNRPTILPCATDYAGVVGLSTLMPVGMFLVTPDSYSFSTREMHLFWEMFAEMKYTLFVNWSRVRYLEVTDIPAEGVAVVL